MPSPVSPTVSHAPHEPHPGGVIPSPGLRFFGVFETLRALQLPQTTVGDLYEGFNAGVYDFLTARETLDLPVYLAKASACGAPIMDLACGSGRITLPLAHQGYEVTAVDRSQDMLRLLRRRLQGAPLELRTRVIPHRGDITRLSLGRAFRLIILGATSICLLHDPSSRRALFSMVAEHLDAGGVFCFDYLAADDATLRAQDDRLLALAAEADGVKRFTLFGTRHYPDEGVQVVNFYSEEVDAHNDTRRLLASTVKWIVDPGLVGAELAQAGLELISTEPLQGNGDTSLPCVTFISCRKKGN